MQNTNQKLLKKILEEQELREKIHKEGIRDIEPNLLAISIALDEYFVFNKLKIYCELLSYQKIFTHRITKYDDSHFSMIDESFNLINEKYLKQNSLFQIFWYIKELYENFDSKNQNNFTQLLNIINNIHSELTEKEILEIFSYLSNFCIKKINLGEENYLKQLLKINCKMVSIVYSLDSGSELPVGVFKNIVINSLKIKETEFYNEVKLEGVESDNKSNEFVNYTEWIKKFIIVYSKSLSKKHQETYKKYCLASLEFEKKNFNNAHILLEQLKGKRGVFINLDIKRLLVMTQFERFNIPETRSDAFDRLEKALEAYRGQIRYVKSLKQLNYQIDLYFEFYQFCQKLFSVSCKDTGIYYKDSSYNTQKNKLKNEIIKHNPLNKEWLLEKINLLK